MTLVKLHIPTNPGGREKGKISFPEIGKCVPSKGKKRGCGIDPKKAESQRMTSIENRGEEKPRN